MSITVRDIVNAGELSGIRLLSGPEGLEREVTGITIIEAPDIVRFIDGGEILLTALYAFKSSSLEKFRTYIQGIVQKDVSAIMLKLGRHVEEADAKVALLLEIAGAYQIPVIEVPFEMSFRNILVYVLGHLFNEEVMWLKYFKATHDNFAALMLSEEEEESEEGSLSRILDALEKMIGNPIAVFDQRRNCLAATEKAPTSLVIQEDAAPFEFEAFSNHRYLRQSCGEHFQYHLTFPAHYRHKVTLVITERSQPFGLMDSIAVESAVSAFRYEFARLYSVREVEKKYQNDLLYKLLSGELPSPEELGKYSRMLGLPVKGSYRIVVFGAVKPDSGAQVENYKDQIAVTDFLRDTVSCFAPGAKLQNDLDFVTMIQPADAGQTSKEVRESLRRLREQVQREAAAYDARLVVRAGVGRSVEGLANLPVSYEEAKKAWQYADVTAEISGEADTDLSFYSDLGIFTLIVQEKDPEVLMGYVPKGLRLLNEYRKPQGDDLMITLKTYLDRNLNLSKTAQALYIHYKTASYRIEKIAGITGIDFENPNEVLAYRIGFVICRMAQKLET